MWSTGSGHGPSESASPATLASLSERQASTQSKVEWIELFVVSFYAAEAIELFGREFGFSRSYAGSVELAVMTAVGVLMLFVLRPWQDHPAMGERAVPPHRFLWLPRSVVRVLAAVAVLLGVYLAVGFAFAKRPETAALPEAVRRPQVEVEQTRTNARDRAQAAAEREAFLAVCKDRCLQNASFAALAQRAEAEFAADHCELSAGLL